MLAAIPIALAGAKTLYTALNKPKKKDYLPEETLSALERNISNNESDIMNRTLMNQVTKGSKSLGSTMYQQQQRSLEPMVQSGDMTEGQYARGMLEAGSQIQSQVGQTQENAMIAQSERNQQSQDRIANARLQYAQLKDQARSAYLGDKQQWKNELVGGAIDTVTAGFNAYATKIQDTKVKSAVDGFLNGRNITDLDDNALQGLYTTLMLAKLGIK